tara:strand:- start:1624 stop:2121 length:498 start_codon:yes stop_codon:yes gene_type:complete
MPNNENYFKMDPVMNAGVAAAGKPAAAKMVVDQSIPSAMPLTGDTKDGTGRPGVSSGPKDQHGNKIHHADPQFSYKLSKKNQMEVLSRLSTDAKGGDISNMTNKPGTNEMWHPQTLSTTKTGSTHTDFNFTNTFDQAFKSARETHGPSGTFSWRGKTFNTKIKGE